MPIVAVGTDIVSIARLRGVFERHPKRFLSRHFSPTELAYCLAKSDPLPSLAARFAAKEAFQKCWPQAFGWPEVWVDMQGAKPVLQFAPSIQQPLTQAGYTTHLSLSHEREYALAVVVMEQA